MKGGYPVKGAVFPLQIVALDIVPGGLAVRRVLLNGAVVCRLEFWLAERRARAARVTENGGR